MDIQRLLTGQKGFSALIIVAGVVIAALALLAFNSGLINIKKTPATPSPSASTQYNSLSEDPKYKDVKEKYNLSEEQLRILSTVNPNDNN